MKKFNVLIWDFNNNKISYYDVLPYFRNEYKETKKNDRPITFDQWKAFIERWGKYQFWSRCEYEIIVRPWPMQDIDVKIDVWHQIENNIDIIAELLMNEACNK